MDYLRKIEYDWIRKGAFARIALEDMAVAPLVFQKARETGRGVWLDL